MLEPQQKLNTPIICSNCILPHGFLGVKVNAQGLCSYCHNSQYATPNWKRTTVSPEKKNTCLLDWKNTVKDLQAKHDGLHYDCVIGYSGGKDSTALVDTMVSEYKLKPLLITIDTGFMTEVAKENIKDTLTKMNLYEKFVLIEHAIPVFTKLYRYLFLNHVSNEKSLTIKVCHPCTDLIHTIMVKEAMKRGIGHVIIGFSPDQIARYFYETLPQDTLKDGTPEEDFKKELTAADLSWYMDNEANIEDLPRILYPYHVLPYDEQEIIRRVQSKGLIKVGKADPTLTNCHVVKAALQYDFFRYGGLTYALQYAELVRQVEDEGERKKARKSWLRLYKNVAKGILNNTFDATGVQTFYDHIGLREADVMEHLQQQKASDPQREIIEQNINLIRTNKFR